MDIIKNLKGDFILIPVDKSILPLTGLIASIDWSSNLSLSYAICNNLIDFEDDKNILLNTEKKLNINKTIIVKNNKDLALKIAELIKNFNAKSFTLIISNKLLFNLKDIFKSLKSKNIKYKEISNLDTKLEKIIYFKEVSNG